MILIGIIILLFLLLHTAFALAIGFWLLMTSAKLEGWLKSLGAVFGWIIIAIAILLMLISTIPAIRLMVDKDYRDYCPMHRMVRNREIHQNLDKQPCPYGPAHSETEE